MPSKLSLKAVSVKGPSVIFAALAGLGLSHMVVHSNLPLYS